MAMSQTNSKIEEDMRYGQPSMIVTVPDDDMGKNIDVWLRTIPVAYRARRFKVDKYGEISIRNSRASGTKTEKQKILDGECEAKLFVWEFMDGWVLCTRTDVLQALQSDVGYAKTNNDGITSAYYIPLAHINHLRIDKVAADERASTKIHFTYL